MDQRGHSCVRQFFKQSGLHWALTNKTKLKEKCLCQAMLNPRGISFLPFLSSVWGGEFLLFSMVFLLFTDAFCAGQWREVPQLNWWENRFGEKWQGAQKA